MDRYQSKPRRLHAHDWDDSSFWCARIGRKDDDADTLPDRTKLYRMKRNILPFFGRTI